MDQPKAFLGKYINWTFLISILFIVTICGVLSLKADYFVDEIFTYGKANYKTPASVQIKEGAGTVYIPIEDGKIYTPGGKPLMDYVEVQSDNRFNYANVWKNEARAVHPPFHSALVHTVSSFFPGKFSLWYAGVVNIVFAVLTLLALRALSRCYVHDEKLVNIISLTFIFSGGILSAITFLRMYIMSMFWITLMTYIFVRESNEQTGENIFFFRAFAVTLLGALTHYYCILYAVLISVTFGTWLLFEKKYRCVVKFSFAMIASGIVSYMIFPAMVKQIFFGPRGREVIGNAVTVSDFFSRLRFFLHIINEQLFGNWAIILIWAFLLLFFFFINQYCYSGLKEENNISDLIHSIGQNLSTGYMLLAVPTVLFFVIVSKISVYQTDRYMFPVYSNIILLACLLLITIFNRFTISQACKIGLLSITLGMITVKSWFTVGWPYLFLDSKPYLERIAKHAGVDNICLHTGDWQICSLFTETKAYGSIQFCYLKNKTVKQKILKRVSEENPEKLVVSLIGENEKKHADHLQMFLKQCSSLNYCQKLGSSYYGISYLLSRNKEP
jgi:hypothetical protein